MTRKLSFLLLGNLMDGLPTDIWLIHIFRVNNFFFLIGKFCPHCDLNLESPTNAPHLFTVWARPQGHIFRVNNVSCSPPYANQTALGELLRIDLKIWMSLPIVFGPEFRLEPINKYSKKIKGMSWHASSLQNSPSRSSVYICKESTETIA